MIRKPLLQPTATRRLACAAFAMAVIASTSWPARAEDANNACGPISFGQYGPYDYRTDRGNLKIVEEHHFTPKVEAGIGGQSGYVGGDLSYTLNSFPNHHRALIALVRYVEKVKSSQPEGLHHPVECWFDRAIRWRPDDTVVRALYAQFLGKRNRKKEAIAQLDMGIHHAKDNAFSHYNIGLVFLELGESDRALAQAHKAMELGFDRPQLRDRLKAVNAWREPAPK